MRRLMRKDDRRKPEISTGPYRDFKGETMDDDYKHDPSIKLRHFAGVGLFIAVYAIGSQVPPEWLFLYLCLALPLALVSVFLMLD